jgi:hypothetical protein
MVLLAGANLFPDVQVSCKTGLPQRWWQGRFLKKSWLRCDGFGVNIDKTLNSLL